MKSLTCKLLLLISFIFVTTCVEARKNPFKSLAKKNDATYIHIPGIITKMAKSDTKDCQVNLSGLPIEKSIKGISVLTSEDTVKGEALKSDVLKFLEDNGYEMMIKMSDHDNDAHIYFKELKRKSDLVILAKEKDSGEMAIVVLNTSLSKEDLMKEINGNK